MNSVVHLNGTTVEGGYVCSNNSSEGGSKKSTHAIHSCEMKGKATARRNPIRVHTNGRG